MDENDKQKYVRKIGQTSYYYGPENHAKAKYQLNKYLRRSRLILGESDSLTQILQQALESNDLRQIETAIAAYDGQPAHVRDELLNGWRVKCKRPSIFELSKRYNTPQTCILQIRSEGEVDDYNIDGRREFVLGHKGAPILVQILEGTSKEFTISMLMEITEFIAKEWDELLRFANSLDPEPIHVPWEPTQDFTSDADDELPESRED